MSVFWVARIGAVTYPVLLLLSACTAPSPTPRGDFVLSRASSERSAPVLLHAPGHRPGEPLVVPLPGLAMDYRREEGGPVCGETSDQLVEGAPSFPLRLSTRDGYRPVLWAGATRRHLLPAEAVLAPADWPIEEDRFALARRIKAALDKLDANTCLRWAAAGSEYDAAGARRWAADLIAAAVPRTFSADMQLRFGLDRRTRSVDLRPGMRLRVQSALNFQTDPTFGLMPGAETTFDLGLLQGPDLGGAHPGEGWIGSLAPLLERAGTQHFGNSGGRARSVVTTGQFAGFDGRRRFWRIIYARTLGPEGVQDTDYGTANLFLNRSAVLVGADTADALRGVTERLARLSSTLPGGRDDCNPWGSRVTCFIFRAHGIPIPLIPVRIHGTESWVPVGTRLSEVLARDGAASPLPFSSSMAASADEDTTQTTTPSRFEMLARSAAGSLRLVRRFSTGPARLDATHHDDPAALLLLPLAPGDDVTW